MGSSSFHLLQHPSLAKQSFLSLSECQSNIANKWVLSKFNVTYTLTDGKNQRSISVSQLSSVIVPLPIRKRQTGSPSQLNFVDAVDSGLHGGRVDFPSAVRVVSLESELARSVVLDAAEYHATVRQDVHPGRFVKFHVKRMGHCND